MFPVPDPAVSFGPRFLSGGTGHQNFSSPPALLQKFYSRRARLRVGLLSCTHVLLREWRLYPSMTGQEHWVLVPLTSTHSEGQSDRAIYSWLPIRNYAGSNERTRCQPRTLYLAEISFKTFLWTHVHTFLSLSECYIYKVLARILVLWIFALELTNTDCLCLVILSWQKRKLLIKYININELKYIGKMPQGVDEPCYQEKMLLRQWKILTF